MSTLLDIRSQIQADAGFKNEAELALFPAKRLDLYINQAQKYVQLRLNDLGYKQWEISSQPILSSAKILNGVDNVKTFPISALTGMVESPKSIQFIETNNYVPPGVYSYPAYANWAIAHTYALDDYVCVVIGSRNILLKCVQIGESLPTLPDWDYLISNTITPGYYFSETVPNVAPTHETSDLLWQYISDMVVPPYPVFTTWTWGHNYVYGDFVMVPWGNRLILLKCVQLGHSLNFPISPNWMLLLQTKPGYYFSETVPNVDYLHETSDLLWQYIADIVFPPLPIYGRADEKSVRDFIDDLSNGMLSATLSSPEFMRLDNLVYIAPVAITIATVHYYRYVYPLILNTDVCEIPDDYIEFVVKRVCLQIDDVLNRIQNKDEKMVQLDKEIKDKYTDFTAKQNQLMQMKQKDDLKLE